MSNLDKKIDIQISTLEFEIAQKLHEVSTDVKSILKKTEGYDGKLLIPELMDNKALSAKLMPDWMLLLKYVTARMFDKIRRGIPPSMPSWNPIKQYDTKYKISTLRQLLTDAVAELDKGKYPTTIAKDDGLSLAERKLQALKLKKERINNPEFKKYVTTLLTATGRHEETKNEIGVDVSVNIEYSLCPICSDLLTHCHEAIAEKDDSNN